MNIDFMKFKGVCGVLSTLLVMCSLVYLLAFGVRKNVDFAGGTKLSVYFANSDLSIVDLRDAVSNVEPNATIVEVQSSSGSIFSIKVKRPEVERGKEAEASLARLQGLQKAFSSLKNEDAALLERLGHVDVESLTAALTLEDPYAIEGSDSERSAAYSELARKVKDGLDGKSAINELAISVDSENSAKLTQGLLQAFPAINRTTGDLLNAIFRKHNPLGRGAEEQYDDVVDQIASIREKNNDFISSFEQLAEVEVRDTENAASLQRFFRDQFVLGSYRITSNETFSPSIAAELMTNAWGSILLALLGILAYVALRFNGGYAVSAVTALSHDVIIALGIFAISGAELSNPVVAAFLTIVGYSLNDTIVVFDRIRDNLQKAKSPNVLKMMNTSINQTLSRTVVTSLTTFFVVAVIYWGSDNATLEDFAFPLLIGIVVGTYSSVFVASPTLFHWHHKVKKITA